MQTTGRERELLLQLKLKHQFIKGIQQCLCSPIIVKQTLHRNKVRREKQNPVHNFLKRNAVNDLPKS